MGGFCGSKSDAMSVKDGVIQNECFVDVLNIIPHALLAVVCIFILTAWNHSVIGKLKVKTWVHYQGHSLRWIVTLALLTSLVVEIAEGVVSDLNHSDDSTNYHAFIPSCVAFVGALLSIIFYHNVEMWNSPRFLQVLLIYWPLAVVLKCLKALSMYGNDFTLTHLKVWLALMDILCYLLLLFIELNVLRTQRYCIFKKSRRRRPPGDLENTRYIQSYVNFLSKTVYWWLNSILIRGFKHPLSMKDLGKLPQSEKASRMYKNLRMIFEEETFKAGQKNKEPSLFLMFFRATWPKLVLAGLFRLFGDCLAFVGPLLIERIVNYAYELQEYPQRDAHYNGTHTDFVFVTVDEFFSSGYVLAVVLLLTSLLQHGLLQNHHYLVIREGIRMRTAVQTMVYSKVLKLSSLVLTSGNTTVGQIMNHMSIDSTFVMYFFYFIHYIWALPIQVGVALAIMYYKLGLSALMGGIFVIICAPLMYALGVAMARLQKKVMIQSDKRVKKTNEVVQGIKVIKLLAWERGFITSVLGTRKQELSYLLINNILKALMGFIGLAAPVIGTLLTFALYPEIEKKPITTGATMAVLALFNLLQGPLQIMSILSASIANARVSCHRLTPFLLAAEVGSSHDSIPSFSKSCSIGQDSAGASGHLTVDKLDSVASLDGKIPTFELQSFENKSCRSSICSNNSVKLPPTPTHSRQNSGDYSQKLGMSPTGIGLTLGDYKRRRNLSSRSIDEDDAAIEDYTLTELQNVFEIQAGNFSWDLKGEEVTLRDINIKIPTGKLTAIVGQVGSGKSSMLSALLDEMLQVSGNVHKTKNIRIAYVSQKPWLLNASMKDNILFGKPFVWRKYKKVISACALQPDIDMFPAADNTEIGERGLNLSGGQKQRVSIARALYSEADTILLDDPMSALDSQVGKHIMDEAIMRRMVRRNHTVIMVTHHLQYLSHAHQVIVMANGHVHFHGKVGEVKKFDPDLYEVWRKAIRDAKAAEISQRLEPSGSDSLALERKHSGGSQSQLSVPGQGTLMQTGRKMSAMSVMTEASNEEAADENAEDEIDGMLKDTAGESMEDKGRLIRQEHKETGAVSVWVYLRYLKACTVPLCVLSILCQITFHGLIVSANFWLSIWASESNIYAHNLTLLEKSSSNNTDVLPLNEHYYLMIFVYLSVGSIVATIVGCLVVYYSAFVGCRNLFINMLSNVLHLPMRFFETNQSGRILNRFSSDVTAIDQRLGGNVENLLRCMFCTLSAVIVNTITTPYFLFAAVPFFVMYYFLQRFFRATARELQRLDSVTKSHVYSHFSETLSGLEVIRAFGAQSDFKRRAFKAIDTNITPFLFIQTTNRWLGIRLDFMSCFLVFFSAIASLSSGLHGDTHPAFVGLCITYTLMVSGQLNWIVRISSEVEMSMNAVERVMEYTDLQVEPSVTTPGPVLILDSWPNEGKIEFQCVTLSYDIELEPVLNNASFVIQGGEKIGVCGRTGSGKSSTLLGLFRLLDINEGTISIDGVDISRVELSKLRSSLAIIPQDPVLFTGSVRFNLDPTNSHDDEKLWSALESVEMQQVIASFSHQLDTTIVEGGENLSLGQRQLMCLARAFLRNCKIIVMDEATASIDFETDTKIQSIIHSGVMEGRTVITIAHRISTIMNYDKVMVLEYGDVREFDKPQQLLEDIGSLFYGLVHGASDADLK